MFPIITLIFVVALSMLITKIATIALVHTGLTRQQARFQARSAFSGSGFTTSESELIMKHPVRRRIITHLMLVGSVGVVTVISSLIIGFADQGGGTTRLQNGVLLILGISCLYLATRSKRLDMFLNRVISKSLDRFTDIRVSDFSRLLTLMGGYEVTEVDVAEVPWMVDQSLRGLQLREQGVLVLGIRREAEDFEYIGIPKPDDVIRQGDFLVLYATTEAVEALCARDESPMDS